MAPERKANVDGRYRFTGREGVRRFIAMARRAFPGIQFKLEQRVQEAGGNPVYVWSAKAQHTGDMEGHPATGEQALLIGRSNARQALPEQRPGARESGDVEAR
jgi:hypothetical protein